MAFLLRDYNEIILSLALLVMKVETCKRTFGAVYFEL